MVSPPSVTIPGITWPKRLLWSLLYRASEWSLATIIFFIGFLGAESIEALPVAFASWNLVLEILGLATISALIVNGYCPRITSVLRATLAALRSGVWLMFAGAVMTDIAMVICMVFTVVEWLSAAKATWDYKTGR